MKAGRTVGRPWTPVWLVARWEYVTRVRSKMFLLATLAMPLLIVGMIYLPTLLLEDEDPAGLVLAIVDGSGEWGAPVGRQLDMEYRTGAGEPSYPRQPLQASSHEEQSAEAAALLDAGLIGGILIIGPRFLETGRAEFVFAVQGQRAEQAQLRSVVQAQFTHARFEREGIGAEEMAILERRLDWSVSTPEGEEVTGRDYVQAFMVPIVYAMILVFAIFMSSQMLMRGIITERSNRVVELLLCSISPGQLLQGKIIGLGLVGLTQLAVYLLVTSVAGATQGMQLFTAPDAGYFLLYALLGYFFYAAVYVSLGSLFETEQEAQQVAGLLSLVPVAPLVFSAYVITHPDVFVVRAASFFPPLTPFLMMMRLAVVSVPWWEIAGTALTLALFTALMMRWSGAIFRTAVLMYGKRVTLREIARWARAR